MVYSNPNPSFQDPLPLSFKKQEAPALLALAGAAMRRENPFISVATSIGLNWDNYFREADLTPGFNPVQEVIGTKYERHIGLIANSRIRDYYDFNLLLKKIDQEEEDDRILGLGGAKSIPLMMASGVFDPMMMIPGVGLAKIGSKSGSVLVNAARIGGEAAAAVVVQEGILQASQALRTTEESEQAIASGALLGAILGGGMGYLYRGRVKLSDDIGRNTQWTDDWIRSLEKIESEEVIDDSFSMIDLIRGNLNQSTYFPKIANEFESEDLIPLSSTVLEMRRRLQRTEIPDKFSDIDMDFVYGSSRPYRMLDYIKDETRGIVSQIQPEEIDEVVMFLAQSGIPREKLVTMLDELIAESRGLKASYDLLLETNEVIPEKVKREIDRIPLEETVYIRALEKLSNKFGDDAGKPFDFISMLPKQAETPKGKEFIVGDVIQDMLDKKENVLPKGNEILPVSDKEKQSFIDALRNLISESGIIHVPIWKLRKSMNIDNDKFNSILATLRNERKINTERRTELYNVSEEEVRGSVAIIIPRGYLDEPEILYNVGILENKR